MRKTLALMARRVAWPRSSNSSPAGGKTNAIPRKYATAVPTTPAANPQRYAATVAAQAPDEAPVQAVPEAQAEAER